MIRKSIRYWDVVTFLFLVLPRLIFSFETSWYAQLTGSGLEEENSPFLYSIDIPNGSSSESVSLPKTIFPFGVAISPDGQYAYAVGYEGEIYKIGREGLLETISVGGFLSGVAISTDGNYLYVGQYVGPEDDQVFNIVRIDIKTVGASTFLFDSRREQLFSYDSAIARWCVCLCC